MAVLDEHVHLKYLQWEDTFNHTKPYQIFSTGFVKDTGLPATNYKTSHGPKELVRDLRGCEKSPLLDVNGFQVEFWEFQSVNCEDADEVKKKYIPQVTNLLRQRVSGADEVLIYDWKVCIILSGYNFSFPIAHVPRSD